MEDCFSIGLFRSSIISLGIFIAGGEDGEVYYSLEIYAIKSY